MSHSKTQAHRLAQHMSPFCLMLSHDFSLSIFCTAIPHSLLYILFPFALDFHVYLSSSRNLEKPLRCSYSSPCSHRVCRKRALDSSLPSGLHHILPQLLQVFSASAGQVKFPGGEILVGQEAELFLGTEASCSTKVMKSLSPLSPDILYGLFLPETKCDSFTEASPTWPSP